jgi:TolA-binding protein
LRSDSGWALGVSFATLMLLLVFAALMVYVTDTVEGKPQQLDTHLQTTLDAATEKNKELEKQLNEMTLLVDELKLMVGAKVPTKDGLQEAVDTLKRGYALCQKSSNTLIEAVVQNGAETIQVIGDVPSDLRVNLAKGDQTSDLEEIVTFLQDVFQYEKDQSCRFNYRLKYVTDNDYRKARESFEKYFYPERMIKTG